MARIPHYHPTRFGRLEQALARPSARGEAFCGGDVLLLASGVAPGGGGPRYRVVGRFDEELGGRLRRAREAKGWTQMQLAAEVGLSQDAVSLYERGRRTMRVDVLVAVAQALDVPLSLLLDTHPDVVVIRDTPLADVIAQVAASPERLRTFFDIWDFMVWRAERGNR